jgi:ADP-ribosyl-[dinitrogen reductase] hydrolase
MDDIARIRAGIVAFCAGDALGVPWEGTPPGDVRVDGVGRREDWPRGSTSDDTDQLLLAARVVADGDESLERRFLDGLAAGLASMRGAGPTTTAAVARFRETGAERARGGATNGAAMRAPVAGWATARRDARRRRRLALRLAHTTHAEPAALGAACVVAAMVGAGVEGCDAVEAARREAQDGPVAALAPVLAACDGAWQPPAAGIPLDAAPTAAAVVHVVRQGHETLDGALRAAIALGGDTDTVAALVGAVVGPALAAAGAPEPAWLADVRLPPPAELDALAAGLAARR